MAMAMLPAILTAASTVIGAVGSAGAMKSQAAADQQRAQMEAAWKERQADEQRAAGQRQAGGKLREMELAQSRLTALAGASGGRADDPTVLKLMGDIEGEGRLNAKMAQAGGEKAAQGLEYQGSLDRWTADANARIKKSSANTTLIGGLLGAAGGLGKGYYDMKSPMSSRYGGESAPSYRYG